MNNEEDILKQFKTQTERELVVSKLHEYGLCDGSEVELIQNAKCIQNYYDTIVIDHATYRLQDYKRSYVKLQEGKKCVAATQPDPEILDTVYRDVTGCS